MFDEGDAVHEGQPVAQLETADLQADLALRRAELHAAEAALAELRAGSRPDEIAAAEATMHKAEANYAALKAGSRPEEIAASDAEFHAAEVDRDRLQLRPRPLRTPPSGQLRCHRPGTTRSARCRLSHGQSSAISRR